MAVSADNASVTIVSTTDATQTTCGTYTIALATVVNITAFIEAYSAAAGDAKVFQLVGGIERIAGGAVVLGSILNLIAAQGTAGATTWAATMDVSGNDVRVRVTGALATSISWRVRLAVDVHTP